jgi:hypothetical protein
VVVVTIPTPITIYHKPWIAEGGTDAHGNAVHDFGTAVARKVQSINEFGRRGSSHEVISSDYLNRVETVLEIGVPDVSIYAPRDQIIIGATGVDGNGIPVGGIEFHVEGVPSDNKLGPLPLLNRMLGGAVRVRRVT